MIGAVTRFVDLHAAGAKMQMSGIPALQTAFIPPVDAT